MKRVTPVHFLLACSPNNTTNRDVESLDFWSDWAGPNSHVAKKEHYLAPSQAPFSPQRIGIILIPTHRGGVRFESHNAERTISRVPASCGPLCSSDAARMIIRILRELGQFPL